MKHSLAMVDELNTVKRLILKDFRLRIGILMRFPDLNNGK
jgi:hypothetical protein